MEIIKDLDLLINEGEKVARFAKLFAKVPEILKALNSAQVHLQEVNKAVSDKTEELNHIKGEIAKDGVYLASLTQKVLENEEAAQRSEKESNARISAIKKQEAAEIEKIRKMNRDAIEASTKAMNDKLAEHQQLILASQQSMAERVDGHAAALKALDDEEQAALKKVERANKKLVDLIAKIKA